MNVPTYSGWLFRLAYRLILRTGRLGARRVCNAFGGKGEQRHDVIRQLLVINLDRQATRWSRVQRELQRIRSSSTTSLREIADRLSAVDAREYIGSPSPGELQTVYSLADQLFVEPNPLLTDQIVRNQSVAMSRQEIAVALSHIAAWRVIASGEHAYTLVLEDDVYFSRSFARTVDTAWAELMNSYGPSDAFDLLYLSYKEAKTKATKKAVSDVLFTPCRGLWYLSGYVLSRSGAAKLLELLPVRGPVDLWINHQFHKLDVFATHQSTIQQRLDSRSDNLYSILPVLSRVGALTREKPLLFKTRKLPNPVFALGEQGTGLTSLAIALSMLGYRCCSDISELPMTEHDALFGSRQRVFGAYVNIGSLSGKRCLELAKLYPSAKFIFTVGDEKDLIELNQDSSNRKLSTLHDPGEDNDSISTMNVFRALRELQVSVLVLSVKNSNKWRWLCGFLECERPNSEYPALQDQGQRDLSKVRTDGGQRALRKLRKLKHDSSPWIASGKQWQGVRLTEASITGPWHDKTSTRFGRFQMLDTSAWMLRDDTFPSNLALFRPSNFAIESDGHARVTLCKESSAVREYTSGAICSRRHYLYGHFAAEVRPAKVSGLITGVFLHRNSPRQEIDIEFLGKDTTKLLINVYYNPGGDGANLEYGYRGTPVLVDLGFDAAKDFHQYSIEWSSTSIRWLVDGHLACERANWDPTPVPHLPMQFCVNLWHSRSEELAGRLRNRDLPAHSEIESIEIQSGSTAIVA